MTKIKKFNQCDHRAAHRDYSPDRVESFMYCPGCDSRWDEKVLDLRIVEVIAGKEVADRLRGQLTCPSN